LPIDGSDRRAPEPVGFPPTHPEQLSRV
jgi:hypothetical protein